ncbi:MAG: efflux RND transporter periplasmic adaptor subunit [Proteobacteria bacterium]|nr:efflux RND transporter periplasmic adaptor subunit [Pseudomonadota bacterium]MBI3497557.1 efflux RND transporter periplasmic adaptor subunit [Pseudomonadota bacterium]
MRLALIVSGFGVLAVGAALYFGRIPADVTPLTASLLAYFAPPQAASPGSTTPPPVPVTVTSVRVEDVPILLSGIGTVQAYNAVSIRSRVDGELVQILFQEGQDVKAGDPLAIIDPRPFQAQLAQQEAMRARDQALLEAALADMRRYDDLVQRNYATRQQAETQRALVEQYRAQLRSDEAQITYAATQLGYTRITAPIGGRVGIRQIDQGNHVRASDNTPIVVISQLQPISVIFTLSAAAVSQTSLSLGKANAPVTALAQDDKTELDQGTVELVDNQVDPATGTIKLKARFPNGALRLWPGDFVNGRIVVDTRKAGMTVPSEAVRHGPRGDFVWLVKPDNKVGVQSVRIGQTFGGRSLINDGLSQGQQVVTQGYYRLEDGSRIEIQPPK